MNSDRRNTSGSLSLGLALVVFAGTVLFFTKDIVRTPLAGSGDPGPRLFPVALCICLLIGGVWEVGRWAAQRWRSRPAAPPEPWWLAVKAALAHRGNVDTLLLVALLGACIAAIGWLSFSLSMFLFASIAMTHLGFPAMRKRLVPEDGTAPRRVKWVLALLVTAIVSLAVAALLIAAVELLFVHLFKVQFPDYEFGLPF